MDFARHEDRRRGVRRPMYRITGHYHGLASHHDSRHQRRVEKVTKEAKKLPASNFAASAMDPSEGPSRACGTRWPIMGLAPSVGCRRIAVRSITMADLRGAA